MKSRDRIRTVEPPEKSDADLAADLATLGETDTDNAQRFARRFGGKAIHTPGRGWLVYDGKRWRPDNLLQVTELAKQTARRIVDEAQHLENDAARAARSKFASQSLSKGALDRMLDLAKSLVGSRTIGWTPITGCSTSRMAPSTCEPVGVRTTIPAIS